VTWYGVTTDFPSDLPFGTATMVSVLPDLVGHLVKSFSLPRKRLLRAERDEG